MPIFTIIRDNQTGHRNKHLSDGLLTTAYTCIREVHQLHIVCNMNLFIRVTGAKTYSFKISSLVWDYILLKSVAKPKYGVKYVSSLLYKYVPALRHQIARKT